MAALPAPRATITDGVFAPTAPPADTLARGVFAGAARRLGGLVRYREGEMRAGPLRLLTFGPATPCPSGWRWPITGGLLARRPGGEVVVTHEDGRLVCRIDGYAPTLPEPLFRATQLRVHHLLTRLALLDLRGRRPPPGMPAEPVRRLAAAAVDVAACAALSLAILPGRRLRRRGPALLATVAAYHIGCWTLGGRTLGHALTGTRVVATDGGPISPGQAAVRLLALPLCLRDLRTHHDDLAATDVIVQ